MYRLFQNGSRYDPKDFHVIGFSLGAHVAGFTGKEFRKHREDERKIGRITGKSSNVPIAGIWGNAMKMMRVFSN